jgi:hypothetical protein
MRSTILFAVLVLATLAVANAHTFYKEEFADGSQSPHTYPTAHSPCAH